MRKGWSGDTCKVVRVKRKKAEKKFPASSSPERGRGSHRNPRPNSPGQKGGDKKEKGATAQKKNHKKEEGRYRTNFANAKNQKRKSQNPASKKRRRAPYLEPE